MKQTCPRWQLTWSETRRLPAHEPLRRSLRENLESVICAVNTAAD